jgi:2-octaprenyl-6-methoxyphenol hydroxylase
MKVSILGNGLTSLALAKLFVNQGINVDIFSDQKFKKNNKIQTLGISKSNIDFFNKNILDISKFLWNIDKIEIFSENSKNEKILNFGNNNTSLFSIIKNFDLYNYLFLNLNKNKLVKFKKKISYNNLVKKNYKLIFNCDYHHSISKKFFYKKINKNYNSFAYISTFKHEKLSNNNIASQIFTLRGPLAFLPISPTETSIVYSVRGKKKIDLENLIKKYNTKYKILKINKFLSFELRSSSLRSYYHDNIIAFGDLLHKLHPLAGQGFNMTIRDIKKIHELIKFRKEHGLDLDTSICLDFEKNTRDKNYLFLNGIDFIYEFFNFENKFNINFFSKSVKFLGKNKIVNNFFTKFADNGIII